MLVSYFRARLPFATNRRRDVFQFCLVWLLGIACFLFPPARADEPADLVTAAKHKEWQRVSKLVSAGADVTARAPDGMTALHWAALWGNDEVARQLIDADADVLAATTYGVTPLQIAATHGRASIAARLLERGADANSRLISSETVLMQAARTGDVPTVDLLLRNGADANAGDKRGQTALMWAAAEGHAGVLDRLLDAGSKIDTTLGSGFSALAFAVREGRTEVVERLIAAGADVNTAMQPKNTFGRAPRSGMSPLMLAVESGHFELAVRLLDLGADPNDQRSGYAALHAVSWVRKPNRGDNVDGDPPPRGSGSLSSLEFVRALVARGADVNLRLKEGQGGKALLNSRGATPLLFAARTADLQLMDLLVELGGDVNIPNADGCTPLLAAAGVGVFVAGEYAGSEPEVVAAIQFFHKHGAELNTVDNNGETALHGAAYRSFPKVVDLLVGMGVEPGLWRQENRLGSTPLQVAEGKRPGSFKPDIETIRAIRTAMKQAGLATLAK